MCSFIFKNGSLTAERIGNCVHSLNVLVSAYVSVTESNSFVVNEEVLRR